MLQTWIKLKLSHSSMHVVYNIIAYVFCMC